MTKRFCTTCSTLMFGNSSGTDIVVSIRAGAVDQTDIIDPIITFLLDRKISPTSFDHDLAQASAMPQGETRKKD